MDLFVKVGIKTAGPPVIKKFDNYTRIGNMLIGDKFH